MNHKTPDLRVGEELRILRVGLLSGACVDCGEKQSMELLSMDIINSKTITWRGEEGEREGEEGKVGEWISCILCKGRQTSLVLVHESKSLRHVGVYSHFRKPLLVEQVPDPYHLFGIVGQHTNVLWLQPPGHKHLYLKGGGER